MAPWLLMLTAGQVVVVLGKVDSSDKEAADSVITIVLHALRRDIGEATLEGVVEGECGALGRSFEQPRLVLDVLDGVTRVLVNLERCGRARIEVWLPKDRSDRWPALLDEGVAELFPSRLEQAIVSSSPPVGSTVGPMILGGTAAVAGVGALALAILGASTSADLAARRSWSGAEYRDAASPGPEIMAPVCLGLAVAAGTAAVVWALAR